MRVSLLLASGLLDPAAQHPVIDPQVPGSLSHLVALLSNQFDGILLELTRIFAPFLYSLKTPRYRYSRA